MNAGQLHKMEYLLHLLEDGDLDRCLAFLRSHHGDLHSHVIGSDHRRAVMSHRARLMFKLTVGTAFVSISSMLLMIDKIPQGLLVVPFYFLLIGLLWLVKIYRMQADLRVRKPWVVN